MSIMEPVEYRHVQFCLVIILEFMKIDQKQIQNKKK